MNKKTITTIIIGLTVLTVAIIIAFYPSDDSLAEPASITPTEIQSKCIVAGCNGELCIDKDSELGASLCVYREEYKCFQYATCEEQPNGSCGWTSSEEFDTCNDSFSQNTNTTTIQVE